MNDKPGTKLDIRVEVLNHNEAFLCFTSNSKTSDKIPIDFEHLTKLIATLAQARADLVKHPSREAGLFQEGQRIPSVEIQQFYVQKGENQSNLLALNHPGFGPIGITLSANQSARLATLLSL